jgi:hypothetical protein
MRHRVPIAVTSFVYCRFMQSADCSHRHQTITAVAQADLWHLPSAHLAPQLSVHCQAAATLLGITTAGCFSACKPISTSTAAQAITSKILSASRCCGGVATSHWPPIDCPTLTCWQPHGACWCHQGVLSHLLQQAAGVDGHVPWHNEVVMITTPLQLLAAAVRSRRPEGIANNRWDP